MNPKDIQTEVFLLPCLLLRREGREPFELRPAGAVAVQGHRSDRAVQARRGDHERAVLPGEEALPEGRREVPRADPEPHLELRGEGRDTARSSTSTSIRSPRRSTATTSRTCTTRRRPRRSCSARKGTSYRTSSILQDDGSTSCGNWIYSGSYTQKDGKVINMMARTGQGRPDRPRPLSELGLGMAGEPQDHLQPRLRRPERKALGPEAPGHQVEPGKPRNREAGRLGRRCA